MTVKTKEILAELGVLGTPLPRSLVIPVVAAETDLLNIQMEVMDMLTEDPEAAKIVANHWNLGFEIRAFNVQKQVWDLLDPDDNLEIPPGASIQVMIMMTMIMSIQVMMMMTMIMIIMMIMSIKVMMMMIMSF